MDVFGAPGDGFPAVGEVAVGWKKLSGAPAQWESISNGTRPGCKGIWKVAGPSVPRSTFHSPNPPPPGLSQKGVLC